VSIKRVQNEIHANAVAKGWWAGVELGPEAIAAKLCLVHSEVSEALEEIRDGNLDRYFNGSKPEGFGIELADIVIRCLDLAAAMGIDLESEIETKMEYNRTRPYKHGGKSI